MRLALWMRMLDLASIFLGLSGVNILNGCFRLGLVATFIFVLLVPAFFKRGVPSVTGTEYFLCHS